MKKLTVLLCLIANIIFAEQVCLANTPGDHLVPVQSGNPSFRAILASKLLLSPFTHGRAIVRPAFEGESSISVYCRLDEHRKPHCYVALLIASENLYQRTDGGTRPKDARSVTVHRVDAQISEHIAKNVHEIWSKMLKSSARYDSSEDRWAQVPIDATRVELDIKPTGRPVARGEVNRFAPKIGDRTRQLLSIVDLLVDYCKASPPHREKIESKLQAATSHLLQLLE